MPSHVKSHDFAHLDLLQRPLSPDQLDVEKSWFAEESMMNNVRQLMHNYAAKKSDLQGTAKAEKNKINKN